MSLCETCTNRHSVGTATWECWATPAEPWPAWFVATACGAGKQTNPNFDECVMFDGPVSASQ